MANKPDAADFSPEMSQYSGIGKFKAWVQMVLPQVYDDALSYQELVYKMLYYMNTVIDDLDSTENNVTALKAAYDSLENYVNTWFDNLDVQDEVDNILDEYVEDGTLSALIQPLFDAYKTAIDTELSEFEEDVETEINTQNGRITTLESRMDTFSSLPEGSTTADAELADIRVTWNGETYNTAGNAVRGQCEDLHNGIEVVGNSGVVLDLNDTDYTVLAYCINAEGNFYRSGSSYKSYKIPCSPYYSSITITGRDFAAAAYNRLSEVVFCKGDLPDLITSSTSGTSASEYMCTGETAPHTIYFMETVTFDIPSDCEWILIRYLTATTDVTPNRVIVGGSLADKVNYVDNKLSNVIDNTTLTLTDYAWINAVVQNSGGTPIFSRNTDTVNGENAQRWMSYQVPVTSGWKYIKIIGAERGSFTDSHDAVHHATTSIAFLKSLAPYAPTNGGDATDYMCVNNTLPITFESSEEKLLTIPNDCKYILISKRDWHIDVTPVSTIIEGYFTELSNSVLELNEFKSDYDEKNEIPDYYFSYMTTVEGSHVEVQYLHDKIETILKNRDEMSANSDSFILIADHHSGTPTQIINKYLSGTLIDYVSSHTGITKLVNVGDSGGSSHTTDKYASAMNTTWAINRLAKNMKQSFFILGNHEWNTIENESSAKYTTSGVLAYFAEQYKTENVVMDEETGCYYFDNPVNKIRYFFIQVMGDALPLSLVTVANSAINTSVKWFGDELHNVPADYTVVTFIHYAYIPPRAWYYAIDMTPPSNPDDDIFKYGGSTRFINQLLKAFKEADDVTLTTTYESYFDYSDLVDGNGNPNRHVAVVIGGHKHHGFLYMANENISETEDEQQSLNKVSGVPVFSAGCDAGFSGSIQVDGHAWYWLDDEIGGFKVVRYANTVNQGLFYVVQIDIDNKVFKITAIGGDNDYEGAYEVVNP